jgi:hypothetical protein
MIRRTILAAVLAGLAAFTISGQARAASLGCGLPDAQPLWIEFSDGSVEFRQAVFGKPGVVVATNGVDRAAELRALGAQTVYWHMNMRGLVGTPTIPLPEEAVQQKANALLERAKASTGCAQPVIALNELWGVARATPWPESVLLYRNNVLVLMRTLRDGGALPMLLVPGPSRGSKAPFVGDAAADWWRQVAEYGHIVKQLYFNGPYIDRRGPILGSRVRRTSMRDGLTRFTEIGIPATRLGIMVGFQSGPGSGGREGLQPSSAWFELIKREALAARQVAAELGVGTVWSWGWGTFLHFAPEGADPDKPVAACVYLWAHDQSLCDGPTAAGPDFDPSLTIGQIILPAGAQCAIGDDVIETSAVEEIERVTGDRQLALRAALQRLLLAGIAEDIGDVDARAAERAAVEASFGGSQDAYLAELESRGLTRQAAKNALIDVLRRHVLQAQLTFQDRGREWTAWMTREQKHAIREAICIRDEVPKKGFFDWASALPFLSLPEPAVTIETDRRVVRKGAAVTLSGVVESLRPNEVVTVYAAGPGKTAYSPIGESSVDENGAWSLVVRPTEKGVTTYRALSKSAVSKLLAVRVKGAKGKK